MDTLTHVNNLLEEVLKSDSSAFYRDFYEAEGFVFQKIETPDDLKRLPSMTRDFLTKTPLLCRLYKKKDGFVRVVRDAPAPFLIKRCADDLASEDYRETGRKRPFIMLTDSDNACEKAWYCYEKNILPLAGEPNNLAASVSIAAQYEIDCVLSEPGTWGEFWRMLCGVYDVERVKNLILVGKSFAMEHIIDFFPVKNIALVLDLPETGAFARNCPEAMARGEIVFHEDNNGIVEIENGRIILTKLVLLPTPIIRYETGLKAHVAEYCCFCGAKSFVLSKKNIF